MPRPRSLVSSVTLAGATKMAWLAGESLFQRMTALESHSDFSHHRPGGRVDIVSALDEKPCSVGRVCRMKEITS